MGFLTPASFWFLSFIGVLLLFYFFKKQFDRKTISSIYLWEQTVKEWETNRWWKKLQRSLLLLLQVLVMLFLIFALAHPYVNGKGVSGEQLVIVLDTSASMAVQEGGGTRFDKAKKRALQMVDSLTAKQAVTLIEAKRTPRLIEAKTHDHRKVKEAIKNLKLSYQHADFVSSVRLADSLVRNHGEIHIFTDRLKQQQLAELDPDSLISVHNIGTSQPNLSLRVFGVRADENHVSAIITVKNEGDTPKKATVSILNGDERLKQVKGNVPAGKQVTFTVKGLPKTAVYTAKIEEKDAYALDNRRWAFFSDETPRTLYLAGDVSPFMEKALQYAGANIVQVPKAEKGTYRFPKNSGDEAVYVLANVPAGQWPKGAKLVLSPTTGGPFQIEKKLSLKYGLKQATDDPMLQYVDVKDVYLGKSYAVGDPGNLKPLIASGDNPIVLKGMLHGAKTVLFAFDIQDSDWPLRPSFPILVQNALTYLTKYDKSLGILFPGESETVTLAPTVQKAKTETADGKELSALHIQHPRLKAPNRPGLYRLSEQTADGLRKRTFAVELDEHELTAQAEKSFTIDSGKEKAADGTRIVKHGVWRWAAALALLVLFVEWGVYSRGVRIR